MTNYAPSEINMHTKLVGVTFNNRQSNIINLHVNDKLCLIREPDNIYDSNAILVCDQNFNELGHISKDLAATLAPILDNGQELSATVENITGDICTNLGVNIFITSKKSNEISFSSFSDISTFSDNILNNITLKTSNDDELSRKLKEWKNLSLEEMIRVLKRSAVISQIFRNLEIPLDLMIDKDNFIKKISTTLYFVLHNAICINPSPRNVLSEIRNEMEYRMTHTKPTDNPFINLLATTIAGILSYTIFNINISFYEFQAEAIDAAFTNYYQKLMDKQLSDLFIIVNSPDFKTNIQKIA